MSDKSATGTDDTQKTGLLPLSPQEQQEYLGKLQIANTQELQRVQKPSFEYRILEIPPYKETPPIGGQKLAGPADFPRPTFPYLTGELLQIEGEWYTVQDPEGQEVRLHVDKRTAME